MDETLSYGPDGGELPDLVPIDEMAGCSFRLCEAPAAMRCGPWPIGGVNAPVDPALDIGLRSGTDVVPFFDTHLFVFTTDAPPQ